MKYRRLSSRWVAGTLFSVFSSVSFAADDLEAGLLRCQAIGDNAARLACFDALAADSAKANEAETPTSTQETPVVDQSAAPNVRPLDDSVGKAQTKSFDPDDAPVYVAKLIRCEKSPTNRTVFYLDNGQVWLQSNTGGRRIRDCDDADVEISKDLFGFLLRIPSQNKSRRVRRVR